jgi:transcriptional regulator GlxA family with amidase domain
MCLHFRASTHEAPQRSGFSHALNSRNPHLIAAMRAMNETIETPLEISDLAEQVGISRRQLERLFTGHVGTTPAQFYMDLRIARAHALLNETDLSVAEIAAATGFNSASQMGARFRKRYGMSPRAYRKSWQVAG